jgi:hypothetical protein
VLGPWFQNTKLQEQLAEANAARARAERAQQETARDHEELAQTHEDLLVMLAEQVGGAGSARVRGWARLPAYAVLCCAVLGQHKRIGEYRRRLVELNQAVSDDELETTVEGGDDE